MATEILRPNAAGDETNINAQYPDSGYHFDKVDEAVADDDTTYVYCTNTQQDWVSDLYNLTAHSGSGTINSVKVYARCITWTTPNQTNLKIACKTNGVVYEGVEVQVTTSWADYSKVWATNPNTGVAWTWDEIDALQVDISVRRATAAGGSWNQTGCTQVYAEVDYEAAAAPAYKDIATRFKLTVKAFRDIATRFKLLAQGYQDTATRFFLGLPSYEDIATRFRLTVQQYSDIATRFKLTVQSYLDVSTRFRFWVQGYEDITTRFKVHAQAYRDIATRFTLRVQGYLDVSTRFKLWVQGYRDIATRFKLIVGTLAYKDIATRFILIIPYYKDIATRFRLTVAAYYKDVGTRFFLYQPTWKESEIQKEVTDLQAQIIEALKPKAHFEI